jgi:hypothetical protein
MKTITIPLILRCIYGVPILMTFELMCIWMMLIWGCILLSAIYENHTTNPCEMVRTTSIISFLDLQFHLTSSCVNTLYNIAEAMVLIIMYSVFLIVDLVIAYMMGEPGVAFTVLSMFTVITVRK